MKSTSPGYPPHAIIDPRSGDEQRRNEADRARVMADPIGAAPAELRHDVWRVWACVQHLFPSPLPLAGMVRVWVDLHGLTAADARAILYSLLSPDAIGSFKFAADLTTHLAGKVSERLKQLAKAAEVERVRQEQADRDAETTPKQRGTLAKMFTERAEGIGAMPAAPVDAKRNAAFVDAARGQRQ